MSRTIPTSILLFSVGTISCTQSYEMETLEFEGPVDRVVVSVDAGDIELRAGEDGHARVVAEMNCRIAVPPIEVILDGSTLHVTMETSSGASTCTGRFEITIPAPAMSSLRTGDGNIEAEGVAGELSATTFKGSIRAVDLVGELSLVAVSGDIAARELHSDKARFTIGAGDLAAVFDQIPEEVDTQITSGNATVEVPRWTYRIEAISETGTIGINGVVEHPTATNTLLVEVTSGDIDIVGRTLSTPRSEDHS